MFNFSDDFGETCICFCSWLICCLQNSCLNAPCFSASKTPTVGQNNWNPRFFCGRIPKKNHFKSRLLVVSKIRLVLDISLQGQEIQLFFQFHKLQLLVKTFIHSFHFIPFQSISVHFIPFHSMSFHVIPFHFISFLHSMIASITLVNEVKYNTRGMTNLNSNWSFYFMHSFILLVLNVGNGWAAGGCWDDEMDHSRKIPA